MKRQIIGAETSDASVPTISIYLTKTPAVVLFFVYIMSLSTGNPVQFRDGPAAVSEDERCIKVTVL